MIFSVSNCKKSLKKSLFLISICMYLCRNYWILGCISSNLDITLFFFEGLDKTKYGWASVILLITQWVQQEVFMIFWSFPNRYLCLIFLMSFLQNHTKLQGVPLTWPFSSSISQIAQHFQLEYIFVDKKNTNGSSHKWWCMRK